MKNIIDNADTSDKSIVAKTLKSDKRKIQKSIRILKQFGLFHVLSSFENMLAEQKAKDALIEKGQNEDYGYWNKYSALDQF